MDRLIEVDNHAITITCEYQTPFCPRCKLRHAREDCPTAPACRYCQKTTHSPYTCPAKHKGDKKRKTQASRTHHHSDSESDTEEVLPSYKHHATISQSKDGFIPVRSNTHRSKDPNAQPGDVSIVRRTSASAEQTQASPTPISSTANGRTSPDHDARNKRFCGEDHREDPIPVSNSYALLANADDSHSTFEPTTVPEEPPGVAMDTSQE